MVLHYILLDSPETLPRHLPDLFSSESHIILLEKLLKVWVSALCLLGDKLGDSQAPEQWEREFIPVVPKAQSWVQSC